MEGKTREEFIVWIRQAMNDRKSVAYSELYQFLVACFVRADINKDGTVSGSQFWALTYQLLVWLWFN